MSPLLLVMSGGAIGAGARFLFGRWTLSFGAGSSWTGPSGWPWGTLGVNLLGAVFMGLLAGVLARHLIGEPWRLFLGVGVLGGFTTFSAFSLETAGMIERGALIPAATYVAVSVTGSVAALFAGLYATRVTT